jgi:hypothetical protein
MNNLDLAKHVASTVVAFGTSTIVGAVIRNNVQPATTFQKVSIPAASFVIGSIASDLTKNYTNEKIDAATAWYRKNITDRKSETK